MRGLKSCDPVNTIFSQYNLPPTGRYQYVFQELMALQHIQEGLQIIFQGQINFLCRFMVFSLVS